MSKIHIRCLLVSATCLLLLGAGDSLALGQDWDPISFAASVGSWAASFVYQPAARDCHPETCEPKADTIDAFKDASACTKKWYVPRGRRCAKCDLDTGKMGVFKDMKTPNAFEIELGNVEIEDTPTPGSEADVDYLSVVYRRYFLHYGEQDRWRFFVGAGVGLYDLEPERELGVNARIGGMVGLNPVALEKGNPYWAFEATAVYHRLNSGLETTDLLIGIRLHLPKSKQEKGRDATRGKE